MRPSGRPSSAGWRRRSSSGSSSEWHGMLTTHSCHDHGMLPLHGMLTRERYRHTSIGHAKGAADSTPAFAAAPTLSREKQAALAAEEARRKARAAEAAAKLRADIGEQRSQREAARLQELQEKRRELVALMANLEVRRAHGGLHCDWLLAGCEQLLSLGAPTAAAAAQFLGRTCHTHCSPWLACCRCAGRRRQRPRRPSWPRCGPSRRSWTSRLQTTRWAGCGFRGPPHMLRLPGGCHDIAGKAGM